MNQDRPLSRRTILRSAGVAIAVPWMESLAAGAEGGEKPPRRIAFLFVPNGIHMPDWTPAEEGTLTKLPSILEPLAKFKSELLVLSGLTLNGGRSLGDGPGDHARCVASFLTGAHPYKTDGRQIHNGVSVDQVAAAKIGRSTRFPSLELGTQASAQAGRCDSGYSCIYTSNMSWRTATSPMAKEINPRAVFDRLFGPPAGEGDRGRDDRNRRRKSILDFVAEDAGDLKRRLSTADRRKLDEYLFAVRQIEHQIEKSEARPGGRTTAMGFPRPEGVPKDFGEHVKLMMDMIVLAFATDATRIATFMYTNAGSNRSYPEIGVRAGHHTLSHHGNDPEKQAKISRINRYHASLFAHFLGRLRGIEEAGGTLLDHSMIVYGSGLADGNRHWHHDLPILVAGRGGGTLRTGRHLRYPRETPLANLYLAMLGRVGVPARSLADSTGSLPRLAGS